MDPLSIIQHNHFVAAAPIELQHRRRMMPTSANSAGLSARKSQFTSCQYRTKSLPEELLDTRRMCGVLSPAPGQSQQQDFTVGRRYCSLPAIPGPRPLSPDAQKKPQTKIRRGKEAPASSSNRRYSLYVSEENTFDCLDRTDHLLPYLPVKVAMSAGMVSGIQRAQQSRDARLIKLNIDDGSHPEPQTTRRIVRDNLQLPSRVISIEYNDMKNL